MRSKLKNKFVEDAQLKSDSERAQASCLRAVTQCENFWTRTVEDREGVQSHQTGFSLWNGQSMFPWNR